MRWGPDFRFLHTADSHLDSPLHGLSHYEGVPADEVRGATRAAFDRMIQFALDERIDFMVIADDLFDGDWRDMSTGLYFAGAMRRLAAQGVPAFVLAGNRDAASVLTRTLPWPETVRLFDYRRPQSFTLPELGVALHGWSFANQHVHEDLSASYPPPDPGVFNIGVLHTALGGAEAGRRTRLDAVQAAKASRDEALASLAPRHAELRLEAVTALPDALEASRRVRERRDALAEVEARILSAGDAHPLDALATGFAAEDPNALSGRLQAVDAELVILAERFSGAADTVGGVRFTFENLSNGPGAQEAAADAAATQAEMDARAETFLLKRAEALTLRWAVDRYREQRQNPLLARASALFATLTLGRYRELKIDYDAAAPRLLGLCEKGESLIGVDAMSEGTSDQLFLALRLAAVEQALAAGIRLPFLADDLFVNFDDANKAAAGLRVLADLARSTQVLLFTHHTHISDHARKLMLIHFPNVTCIEACWA